MLVVASGVTVERICQQPAWETPSPSNQPPAWCTSLAACNTRSISAGCRSGWTTRLAVGAKQVDRAFGDVAGQVHGATRQDRSLRNR